MSEDKNILRYKVLKGVTLEKAMLDSTWTDLRRANNRRNTLKKCLRGNKILVWVVPMTVEDPHNYRKPRKGPWQGYNQT